MSVIVETFWPCGPADTAKLESRLKSIVSSHGIRRLAILGKTEGPATLNDFSRDLAQAAVDRAVLVAGGNSLLTRTCRLFSTGCEGIASPIFILLAETDEVPSSHGDPGLAFGTATSEPLPDAQRARSKHIDVARQTVLRAMGDAGLSADQVRLVLIKSPILSRAASAVLGGDCLRHGGSTGSSRGAASLGAGLALDEIDPSKIGDDPVGRSTSYSTRAMAFSGTEIDHIEALVLGVRPGGDGGLSILNALTSDIADVGTLYQLKARAGGAPRLVFFKAGIPPSGVLRGRRTTVLTSELPPDKQLRSAASGLIAACFELSDTFISAGSEHQGPPGACLCSLIVQH